MNNTEQLKPLLKDYVERITERDPRAGRNMYKCPLCGSGHGNSRSSNGAFSVTADGLAWRCFSCENGGDIFNLIGLYEKLPNFKDQVERAKNIFNVTEFTQKQMFTRKTRGQAMNQATKEQVENYINNCHKDVNKTSYFHQRGFTSEIIERFSLGYDVNKKTVVIPYNKEKNYFITRSIEGKEFRKPKSKTVGEEPIFNAVALKSKKPVFICEAPIDALSIIQAGGEAVALGGTGTQKLIDYIKNNSIDANLILNFDNDEPGQKATEKLKDELKNMNVSFLEAKYNFENYPENMRKDANDLLRGNSVLFVKEIKKNIEQADPVALYKKNNVSNRLNNFFNAVDPTKTIYKPTGFKQLDKLLDGGLYPGLYILGAVSSLGKTTLALQIADNLAKAGSDVLIFSLEMGVNELIAKSLSRLTYQVSNGHGKTSREIERGIYTDYETEILNQATKKYKTYADNIYIFEGLGNIGVEDIKKTIEQHKKLTNKTPVILIDYLQILAPYELRASDKQNTDKAVLELKRISRDYKTPVIGISSFNRDNYNTAVSMTAFKESGAIEYGSDVLIALQPGGMENATTDKDKKKNKEILDTCKRNSERDIEAVILKNRNGATNGKIQFKYYAMFNYFEELNEHISKIKEAVDNMEYVQR